jgi:hypothetical protein
MLAGGCHKDNEPGHSEVPEETKTSSPCPVTIRFLGSGMIRRRRRHDTPVERVLDADGTR